MYLIEENQLSLLQGTISLKRFMVVGTVPTRDELLDGLRRDAFRPFEGGLEGEQMGWCDWRNLLITPPDDNWVIQERFAVFGLRLDTRKVPGSLLKAKVDLRIDDLHKDKDHVSFISKEARTSIQSEVNSELLLKVLPTPKIFEVAWDLRGGTLLTTASSGKAQSDFVGLFVKTFGRELHPITPLLMASRLLKSVSVDYLMTVDPLDLTVGPV